MEYESWTVTKIILLGISLLFLILLSGIFSSSETAFTSVSKFKFDTFYKKRKKNLVYKINNKLLNNYQMTLSTILVSNTLVNVAASTISTLFFTDLLNYFNVADAISLATGLATGIITFLLLMFGEFLPKSIARKHSLICMRLLGPIIIIFYYLFWPINYLLCKIVKQEQTSSATEQELDTLIDIISNEGVIESQEASLVSNALKFDDKQIRSVMTKKEFIVSIKMSMKSKTIINKFLSSTYSRLPVMKNKKYIGVLNLKTFFKYINSNSKETLEDIIDPILFVSQYDTLDKVFKEMQVHQIHMAMVKKNSDSSIILGIVTMENIIESLVGKIYDENDKTKKVTEINNFMWRVDKGVNAKQFINDYLKLKIEVDENASVAQWIQKQFKLRKFVNEKEYENDLIKVVVRKIQKELVFIIEKKIEFF